MIERPPFRISNVQGNILRGNKRRFGRYVMLEVTNPAAARAFLGAAAKGGSPTVPAITRQPEPPLPGHAPAPEPDLCFNIGLTCAGLRALGVPESSIATFPREFTEGMDKRAIKLGDVDKSDPKNWPAPFNEPKRIHIIAALCANDIAPIDAAEATLHGPFNVLGVRHGVDLDGDKVFFGYRDSISQPRFKELQGLYRKQIDPNDAEAVAKQREKAPEDREYEPRDPLGTILLGHKTRLEDLFFTVPSPQELGLDGTFNAFRIMKQDTTAFEAYLTRAAEELAQAFPTTVADYEEGVLTENDLARIREAFGASLSYKDALREVVAAQMCGRWRDARGTPLARSPSAPAKAGPIKNFEFDEHQGCPVGAHIRRSHPRGSRIVQRTANYTRRLMRRGLSYADEFNPAHPRTDFDPVAPSTQERGLLGNFICASLGAQFEAVMYDWVNLGLQHPDITGSNDPLIGANDPATSWFDVLLRNGGTYRLRGFPRFVTTRGGAYLFLPSVPAIAWLAKLPG